MFEDLNDLYQQVILDHSRSPRNFKKLDGANRVAHGHNPLCGDRITIYLHLDGDVIRDISFEGSGCAISKASASVMTSTLKGKTIAEAVAGQGGHAFLGQVPLTLSIRQESDAGRPPAAGEGPEARAFAAIARKVADWLDGVEG